MMDGMMNMMGGMGFGMMIFSALVLLLIILGVAALTKYLFFK